jgi:hypothetical protein
MTVIDLPLFPWAPPFFRVLSAPAWGGSPGSGQTSTTSWTVWPQAKLTTLVFLEDGGMELEEIHRYCLPEPGTAIFHWVYGNLFSTVAPAPDLTYNEIRLQLSLDGSTWVTVFWGQVIAQERVGAAASSTPQGVMKYHCVDGFARTMKWPMDYVGYDGGSLPTGGNPEEIGPCRGHPGYNYMPESDGPLLGNMSPSQTFTVDGTTVPCHTYQGAFSVTTSGGPFIQTSNKWLEIQMINHACSATKPIGEPLFILTPISLATHGYASVSPQPVYPTTNVFDFVTRITNRQRGNGAVFVSWTDNGDGSLTTFLDYCPLFENDITYVIPGQDGATATIEGASTVDQVYSFNSAPVLLLEGDFRNLDEVFSYSDAYMHMVDMLETIGERIEVACTLCGYDGTGDTMGNESAAGSFYGGYSYGITARWSTTDVTNYTNLPWAQRTMPYWDFLYQAFGLPRCWAGCAGDGRNQTYGRVDYRCNANGTGEIYAPQTSDPIDTAPCNTEILGYLPFYEGYDYTGATSDFPIRTDNSLQYGLPQRRPIMVILNTTGWNGNGSGFADFWYLPAGQLPAVVTTEVSNPLELQDWWSPSLTVQPDGIVCKNVSAQNHGLRVISDPVADAANLLNDQYMGAQIPVTRIAFTVGLRLPHRMWFASFGSDITNWTQARKRKVIYIENANLWLASPTCIFDLSQDSADITDQGYAPMRGALLTDPSLMNRTPAILRDDRPLVYRYHVIASKWYLAPRSRVVFGMRYCGLLPFTWWNGSANVQGAHPSLGEFIPTMQADGASLPVGTVVTAIHYNHQTQETTWETDWFDLEHA